jgi:hypothetical protein
MWTSLIENPASIGAIYGNDLPSLNDVHLHEISFINGVELECNLKFDLRDLPPSLPLKWKQRGVNQIQMLLKLSTGEVDFFQYDGGRLRGNLEILQEGGGKEDNLQNF